MRIVSIRFGLVLLATTLLSTIPISGNSLQAQENSVPRELLENSVRVQAPNLEKTLELYGETLGFKLDESETLHGKDVEGTRVMKLSGNQCRVNLLLCSENDSAGGDSSEHTGHNHFVLSISDIAPICEKLKTAGFELQSENYVRDRYSFFTGPNGESICLTEFPVNTQADDWKPLLDAELSQWEAHTGVPHKSVEIPGRERTNSENGIDGGERIGLADPLGIYSVRMVNGEPVLKVTGQVFAGLTTREEFDSYHLSLQFRWGEKKWEPRLDKLRDSGLLFHCVGPHGVGWNAWMQSLECQIQEGDCGDFIPVDKARAFVPFRNDGKEPLGEYEVGVYDPSKPIREVKGKVAVHSPSKEMPHGQWNKIEIYTIGTKSVFVVNGVPNMAIFDAQQTVDGKYMPLSRGKLQIQSEAAELEYRRVKIRSITQFPEKFSALVTQQK